MTTTKTTAASQQESRQFRMHPDLLFSVIKAQAGTLSKALLELVMNSIDAGCSKVDITLGRKSVMIEDDGKGFGRRDEIDQFFETFGTPHKEGDATYGRFRMGRGQIMAFATNQWRSGSFRMDVDVQGRGLDYTLETGLEAVKGCKIDGQLYEHLDPSELITTERTLKEQCRYTPAPVHLNGKLLSEIPGEQKWTVENDDAFIRANDSRQLSVYNLGVLVAHFSSSDFGVGGVVVSKKQLELNFARNDILRNKCSVWKAIRPVLTKLSGELNDKEPTQKRTEEWREFQAKQLATMTEATFHEARELGELPLFTDISGKHLSLEQLCRQAHQRSIAVAPAKSLTADKLHQSKIACILGPDTFSRRFGLTLAEVLDHLDAIKAPNTHRPENHFAYTVKKIREAIVPFDELARTLKSDHHVMAADKVPKDAAACVRAIHEAQRYIVRAMSGDSITESRVEPRKIMAMESETADAFTDGRSHIFINVKLLRGVDGPNNGMSWAARMASLLVHEYCHSIDSGTAHGHDEAFYEAFHDAAASKAFGDAVARLMFNWAQESKGSLGKVGVRIMSQIDRHTRMDDHLAMAAS
jgi:hypothetical protein